MRNPCDRITASSEGGFRRNGKMLMAEPAGAAKDAVSRNSSQLFHKIMCIVLLTTYKIDVILQVEQRKGKAR